MQTIILAGSMGIRLSEETAIKSKPLVEIGSESIKSKIQSTDL
jgi:NDP-sugar pyrophosphorylase family protein